MQGPQSCWFSQILGTRKESKDCCLHQQNFAKLGVFFFHCSSAFSSFSPPQMPVPGGRSRATKPDVCWPSRQPHSAWVSPLTRVLAVAGPHPQQWWPGDAAVGHVLPLRQKRDIKAFFTHMLVYTLQGHGAATLPGLWVGDKDEAAWPCWRVDIFGAVHSSMVWTPWGI